MKAFHRFWFLGLLAGFFPLIGRSALSPQKNLPGKFFVSNVTGAVSCVSDGRILELKKGDSLIARGVSLETAAGASATLVFSNGTGVYIAGKTRFAIAQFDQEFFVPNRNLRVEPSTSSTHVKLTAGRVVVSTPQLLAGSAMVYETPQAAIDIHGEKIVIEVDDRQTRVALVAGAASVHSRVADGTFAPIDRHLVAGQEIVVRNAPVAGLARKFAVAALTTSITSDESVIAATVAKLKQGGAREAPAIAAAAVRAAPTNAAAITAAVLRLFPDQAVQIASSITHVLIQLNSDGSVTPASVQAAAAIAATVTAAAPAQADKIAAAVIESLFDAAPKSTLSAKSEYAAIIASTVTTIAPSDAVAVVVTAMKMLTKSSADAPQVFVQMAAVVISAVTSTAPAQASQIGTAIVQLWAANFPSAWPELVVQATGFFAAVLIHAAPSETSAVIENIASASRQSVAAVGTSARDFAGPVAALGQLLGDISQTVVAASQEQNRDTAQTLAGSLLVSDDGPVPTSAADGAGEFAITPFEPAQFAQLASDLDAAQAAQSGVQFTTETAGDGSVTIQPVPTTPATPPNDFVTSPANT